VTAALVAAIVLVVLNIASFLLFAADKRRAEASRWRISERTLLLSAVLSGTIGAWIAVLRLRHKSRKTSFLLKLGAMSLVDLVIFVLVVPHFV
jgi:uncharacterized membrane protein YsdA (DUF1294 family)